MPRRPRAERRRRADRGPAGGRPRILEDVTPALPAARPESLRRRAALLSAAALLLGAAAPSWRPARLGVRGLAIGTAVGGPLLAILGGRRRGPSGPACPPGDPGARRGAAPATASGSRRSELAFRLWDGTGVPCSLTILIPARNEARVIGPLLSDLGRLRGRPPEVIVIDDASSDGTGDVARAALRSDGLSGCVVRPSRGGEGKAPALARVVLAPDPGRVVVVLDADARVEPAFAIACEAAAGRAPAATARRRVLRPIGGSRAARLLSRLQDDEQAVDDVVQHGRLAIGGAAEFRGNGMLLHLAMLEAIGGWPAGAECEDLELSTLLFQATGRGVDRPPGLVVWEQPVLQLGELVRQRLRWAEGSIRRDLRIVLPGAWRRFVSEPRSIEPLAYAGQALVPWIAIGLAVRCRGSRRGAARTDLAALLGAYSLSAMALAWVAVGRGPDERPVRRLGRTIGSALFATQWLVILPLAWLRVVHRPARTRFGQTAHAPGNAFSEPEPDLPGPT